MHICLRFVSNHNIYRNILRHNNNSNITQCELFGGVKDMRSTIIYMFLHGYLDNMWNKIFNTINILAAIKRQVKLNSVVINSFCQLVI